MAEKNLETNLGTIPGTIPGAILGTVLVVDDERSYRLLVRSVLEDAGFEVIEAESGTEALALLKRASPDLAILDLVMPRMDGRELMRRIRQKDPDLPIIFFTAHGSIPSAVEAIKEGANDYLTKPLPHVDDLIQTVRRILDHQHLKRQNRTLLAKVQQEEPFPAVDPAMVGLLEKARKVAAADVTVLITGESGTGKERLAQYIHHHSTRSEKPMVSLNCAAIVDTLLESELFGHEKGSFTGASERRIGRFEEAHLSTIFLDEIGEMPLSLQPKLLRAIQEREIRRVGGDRVIRFDARVLAATNRDLRESVKQGQFREDLYYRLSVVTLRIPPLRERPADISFLAGKFVAQQAHRFQKPVPTLSGGTEEALRRYSWPGNIRELANVMEATVLLCEGGEIGPQDLHGLGMDEPVQGDHGSPLEAAEKRALIAALNKFNGNRAKTAQFLGMTTRNLLYKIKKFEI